MTNNTVTAITNVAAFALVAFGIHGCAQGHDVYGLAILVGVFSIAIYVKSGD